jgi:hypothetical protein
LCSYSERLIGDVQGLKAALLKQARIAHPALRSPPRLDTACDTTSNYNGSSSSSSSTSTTGDFTAASATSYSYTPHTQEIVAVSDVVDAHTTDNDLSSVAAQIRSLDVEIAKHSAELDRMLEIGNMPQVESLLRHIDSLNSIKTLLTQPE